MSLRVASELGGPHIVEDRPRRRRDIQGLRAVAVLVVVAFHAGLPIPGGFVGVDIFFVISGFVITAMLRREWVESGRIRFREFYWRRFKRLTPALALMVSLTLLASFLVLSPLGTQQTAAKTGVGAMLLGANFVIARTTGGYFDAPAESNPLLNTWSLSVEEQFYLVFPAILVVGWLVARRVRVLRLAPVLLVGVGAVGSFALALVGASGASFPGAGFLLGFYSPFTRAWEFAVGGLLALALAKVKGPVPRSGLLGGVGMALLCASLWLIDGNTVFPGPWTLLPVCGALLVVAAGTQDTNRISRMLSTPPMVKVGDWSYSIYLWHWPVIVFAVLIWPDNPAAGVMAAALSLAPALASYTWVEQPLRRMQVIRRGVGVSLFAATLAVPTAIATALLVGASAQWWIQWPESPSSLRAEQVALKDCTDQPFEPSRCTWGSSASAGVVLLAGDSQAYAFADGVIDAAQDLGMATVVASRSGCPVSSLDTTGAKDLDCPMWQGQVLDYALKTKPAAVVIANRSSGYTRPESGWRTVIAHDGTVAETENAATLYGEGLAEVVEPLREAGIGVVILQNIPESDYTAPEPSFLRRLIPLSEPDGFDPGLSMIARSEAAAAETAVVSGESGSVLFDPVPTLCPGGTCPHAVGGRRIYLDDFHLTRQGSLLLSARLETSIRRAIREADATP